jgi:hypothetical protein
LASQTTPQISTRAPAAHDAAQSGFFLQLATHDRNQSGFDIFATSVNSGQAFAA